MSISIKKIGILTGGGDVPPLNIVISSAYKESLKNNIELIGFFRGWEGILYKQFVKLKSNQISTDIGGTVLRSSRINLNKIEDAESIIKHNLTALDIDALIVIGGEDTLSNAFFLQDIPCVLISKTIDNDVGICKKGEIVNYFTLGYPTAAEKISQLVSLKYGLRTTAYSHERIIVVESMGMHAGWLAIASSLGHPDFIIIPEFPIEYDDFLEKVRLRYDEQRNVIIVVAEGARWSNGDYFAADYNNCDSFGHPRFRGAAEVLVRKLNDSLTKFFDTRNINCVNPSYYYRCGLPNQLDRVAAEKLGSAAVKHIITGNQSSVLLVTAFEGKLLAIHDFSIDGIVNIDKLHRFVDTRLYDPIEYSSTKQGIQYLSKICPLIAHKSYGIQYND